MQALEEMLLQSATASRRPHSLEAEGPSTRNPASILDTSALEGMLDDQAFGSYQDTRGEVERSFLDSGVLGAPMYGCWFMDFCLSKTRPPGCWVRLECGNGSLCLVGFSPSL